MVNFAKLSFHILVIFGVVVIYILNNLLLSELLSVSVTYILRTNQSGSYLFRDNIGYPIAECAADGKFILSKPPNTGGLVSPSTVAEQV